MEKGCAARHATADGKPQSSKDSSSCLFHMINASSSISCNFKGRELRARSVRQAVNQLYKYGEAGHKDDSDRYHFRRIERKAEAVQALRKAVCCISSLTSTLFFFHDCSSAYELVRPAARPNRKGRSKLACFEWVSLQLLVPHAPVSRNCPSFEKPAFFADRQRRHLSRATFATTGWRQPWALSIQWSFQSLRFSTTSS